MRRTCSKTKLNRIINSLVCILLSSTAFGQTADTGTPDIAPYSQLMASLMATYGVPGATLTVTRNGHLILAKGYGMMDQENNVPMQPDTLLRIASISKTITAVTVMHLVEQGKLSLDQPAFALVPDLQAPGGQDADVRLATITIRELLEHAGGWDSAASGYDPTGDQANIAVALGVPSPVSSDNMVRYMRTRMLDFDPGGHFAYSNFGYDLLARIIERVTGMSYEQYVRANVFAPMGITTARIAQTLPEGQLPNESKYYANQKADSIFPDVSPRFVSWAYGGQWYMEGFDGDGGWTISAVDFAKFINGIDGTRGTPFLKPETVALMTARPNLPEYVNTDHYYAFGMAVQPTPNGQMWWNDGAIDGTFTKFLRTDDGVVMVAFFNSRSNPPGRENALQNAVDTALTNAPGQVGTWPASNYDDMFPDADPTKAASAPALNTVEGVRNAATLDRGIVVGSWCTLFGVNLSKTTRAWTSADFSGSQLPSVLDGVSVNIDGKPAFLSYISPTQINAQAPSGITPGWVTVEVINNGVHTSKILTWVTKNAPGAFTYAQDGVTFAAAFDPAGRQLAPEHPATPGEEIVVYATGLASSNAGVTMPARTLTSDVVVQIGGLPATVQSIELVSPGLFQINVDVPAVAPGNQTLTIISNQVSSPAGVFIPIQ